MPHRSQKELAGIINQFIVYGDFLVAVPFGGGHVNDTFQVTFDQGGVRLHYTLRIKNKITDLKFQTANSQLIYDNIVSIPKFY